MTLNNSFDSYFKPVQAAPSRAVGTSVGTTVATGSAKLSVYSDCEAVLRRFDEELFMAELVQVTA
jgi:hypothetical protein